MSVIKPVSQFVRLVFYSTNLKVVNGSVGTFVVLVLGIHLL